MKITIPPTCNGERLDKALAAILPEYSRSAIALLCEKGAVLLNGAVANKKSIVSAGDCVDMEKPELFPCAAAPEDIPLSVVYEDADVIVVNKPRGMVVHPAAGNPDGTLVNALLHLCGADLSGINGVLRPGIVHRIDKNTSGLLVAAKNDLAHLSLTAQLKAHSMDRIYQAIVLGDPGAEGTVDAPIGRSTKDRKKMAVTDKNSKSAITHFRTLESFGKYAHIECRLETGRTHQIRVHMAHIGHPLAGDSIYGDKKDEFRLGGQCLHAKTLGFTHPRTGERLSFDSELPEYFTDVLTKLRNSL